MVKIKGFTLTSKNLGSPSPTYTSHAHDIVMEWI